jgi:hypothetical protein
MAQKCWQLQCVTRSISQLFFTLPQATSLQHTKGPFGRAPAPLKTAPAPAPLVERLFWWSWSRFNTTFGKTASVDVKIERKMYNDHITLFPLHLIFSSPCSQSRIHCLPPTPPRSGLATGPRAPVAGWSPLSLPRRRASVPLAACRPCPAPPPSLPRPAGMRRGLPPPARLPLPRPASSARVAGSRRRSASPLPWPAPPACLRRLPCAAMPCLPRGHCWKQGGRVRRSQLEPRKCGSASPHGLQSPGKPGLQFWSHPETHRLGGLRPEPLLEPVMKPSQRGPKC